MEPSLQLLTPALWLCGCRSDGTRSFSVSKPEGGLQKGQSATLPPHKAREAFLPDLGPHSPSPSWLHRLPGRPRDGASSAPCAPVSSSRVWSWLCSCCPSVNEGHPQWLSDHAPPPTPVPFECQVNAALFHCCGAAAPREAGTSRTCPWRIWIWDTECTGQGIRLQGSSILALELMPEPHACPRGVHKWSHGEDKEVQAVVASKRKRLQRGCWIVPPPCPPAQLSLLVWELDRLGFGLFQPGKPCHRSDSPPVST